MKTIVLCFGNEFIKEDALAKEIVDEIKLENVEFKKCNAVDEVFSYKDYENVLVLDVVRNANKVIFFDDIDKLQAHDMYSLHDFDLSFFLKLMKNIGKIKNIKIIGIPQKGNKELIKAEIIRLLG